MFPGARILLICGLLIGATSREAEAAEPTPSELSRAQELYQNGAVLYEEGNYQGAILAFQASFDLAHLPALHYNIANCYERLGRLTEAKDSLNLYRAVAPAEDRERLERRVANLEERIAAEGARPPAPVAEPAAAAGPTNRGNPLKWTLIGLGAGVTLGGGSLALIEFLEARDALEEGDRAAYDRDRALNGVGLGLAGVGLTATVIGLVLPAHRPESVSLRALPEKDGLALALSGTW